MFGDNAYNCVKYFAGYQCVPFKKRNWMQSIVVVPFAVVAAKTYL